MAQWLFICSVCVENGPLCGFAESATNRPVHRDCAVSCQRWVDEPNHRTWARPPYSEEGIPGRIPVIEQHCKPERESMNIKEIIGCLQNKKSSFYTLAWMYMETMLSKSTRMEHRDSQNRSRPSNWKKLAAAISSSTSFWLTSKFSQPPLYK